jgi:hypothetical protein
VVVGPLVVGTLVVVGAVVVGATVVVGAGVVAEPLFIVVRTHGSISLLLSIRYVLPSRRLGRELNKLEEEKEIYPVPLSLILKIVLKLGLISLVARTRVEPLCVNIVNFLVIFIIFTF